MRLLLAVLGVVLLVFGLGCLNYTKAKGLEHHRAVALKNRLPEPGPGIMYLGVVSVVLGAGVIGYTLGRRSSNASSGAAKNGV
jgi:hypothetical protein